MERSEQQITGSELPPVGEEIHLPGGTIQPLLLAIGLTFAIVGITTSIVCVVFGCALTLVIFFTWIRDAVREYRSLPPEHHH